MGTAAALPLLHFSCLPARGSGAAPDSHGLPQMAKGCPRWPWAAQGGSSHCVAAVEQRVPTAAQGRPQTHQSKRSGAARLDCDTGLGAQRDSGAGPAASLPHAQQRVPHVPRAERKHHRLHILSSVNLMPLPSPILSLFLRKQSSGIRAPPPEPMCTIETVPLVSATDPLLLSNQQIRTRSSCSKDSTLLLPCSFKKAFTKIKKKALVVLHKPQKMFSEVKLCRQETDCSVPPTPTANSPKPFPTPSN